MFLRVFGQRLLPTVRYASTLPKGRYAAYHLVDHDSCLGEACMDPKDIPKAHTGLVAHIQEEQSKKGYTDSYAAIGSNRQGIKLDALNALRNQNNLAYPVMNVFADAIGAWFDPLLLSDITVDQLPGFNRMQLQRLAKQAGINLNDPRVPRVSDEFLSFLLSQKHPDFLYSREKMNLLYASAHRAAHLQGPVDLHFYDDLLKDIIEPAASFYKRFPSLLPSNVTLHFHHYETQAVGERPLYAYGPNLPSLITKVTGEGKRDPNYYETVRRMSEIAREEEGQQSSYLLTDYLTPKRLFEAPSSVFQVAKRFLSAVGLFKTDTAQTTLIESTSRSDEMTPGKK